MTLGLLSLSSTLASAETGPLLNGKLLKKEAKVYIHLHNDKPFTGKAKTEYKNGNPHIEAQFKNGLFHGLYQMWDSEGRLIYKGKYKNGLEHGIHLYWEDTQNPYKNMLKYKLKYVKGVLKNKTAIPQPKSDLEIAQLKL